MGLRRNSACSKIVNEQKQIKLSKNSMGSWANGCILRRIHHLLEYVSYQRSNGLEKRQKTWGKFSMARAEAIEYLIWKFNRNCDVKGSCADFCDRIGQYGNKELWKRQPWCYSARSFSWELSNVTGQELGFALDEERRWRWNGGGQLDSML